jgi:uncharacterized Ntn-hydrolase superfamily protein
VRGSETKDVARPDTNGVGDSPNTPESASATDTGDGKADRSDTLSCATRAVANARNRRCTDEEIDRGLTAVALCSGNSERAARALADQGWQIDARTLRKWRGAHANRYEQLQAGVLPAVYGRIAERAENIAERLADLEEDAADRVAELLPDMKAGEAAGALRNVSVSKAVNIDKASVVRGRPTEIREDRSIEQTLRALARFMPEIKASPLAQAIDTTAEEIPELGPRDSVSPQSAP